MWQKLICKKKSKDFVDHFLDVWLSIDSSFLVTYHVSKSGKGELRWEETVDDKIHVVRSQGWSIGTQNLHCILLSVEMPQEWWHVRPMRGGIGMVRELVLGGGVAQYHFRSPKKSSASAKWRWGCLPFDPGRTCWGRSHLTSVLLDFLESGNCWESSL